MKTIFFIILIVILPITNTYAAFFISVTDKHEYGHYSYQVGPNITFADISVLAGPSVLFPDITIELVDSMLDADLILVDDKLLNFELKNVVNMTIHKNENYLLKSKKIRIGPSVLFPDISVKVGKNVIAPNYRLFVKSSLFTVNEAAGIFVAVWKLERDR